MRKPRGRRPGTVGWKKRQEMERDQPPPCPKARMAIRIQAQKAIGSLPVIAAYLKRCGISEAVDAVCPSANQAHISHADAVVALVANRLSSPQPLYRIEEWAEQFAVLECLGIVPETLNDDRLASALDALAKKADEVYAGVAVKAIEHFHIETSRVHRDLTSIAFYGDYRNQDERFARVLFGWPGANVPKGCKSLRCEIATTEDGAVPLMVRTYSGNETDVKTVASTMEVLQKQAGLSQFLIIGDSKLLSEDNIHRILADGCDFLAPMQSSPALDREILSLQNSDWMPLSYLSEREEKRKREHRRFSGQEVAWNLNVLVDKTKAKTTRRRKNGTEKPEIRTHALRKLFIHSEEEELASQTSRYGRMERVEKQLVHLQETVKNYPTTEQLQRKIAKLLQDKKLTSFYNYAVCGEPRNRPTGLEFSRNEHALQQARRLDGRYVLLTSQSCEKLSLNEALCTYKQQGRLEARFSDWKGPLMVRPVYLKGNQRIVGLVLVMALALLIYTLIERDARKAVASEGGRMWGLYPGGRLSRPTARQMLRVLSTLTLVLINIGGKIAWLPVSPNEVQAKILDMLNVDYPGG